MAAKTYFAQTLGRRTVCGHQHHSIAAADKCRDLLARRVGETARVYTWRPTRPGRMPEQVWVPVAGEDRPHN